MMSRKLTNAIHHIASKGGKNATPLISAPFNVSKGNAVGRSEGPENYAFCNVEFIRQRHINMCGDACFNMLLSYKGKPHEKSLKQNPRGILEGLTSSEMKEKLLGAGLVSPQLQYPQDRKWSAKDLTAIMNEHGPLICMGKASSFPPVYHFVLVFGADQDSVAYHDPLGGANRRMTLNDFNKFLAWDDDACVIAADDPFSNQTKTAQESKSEAESSAKRNYSRSFAGKWKGLVQE